MKKSILGSVMAIALCLCLIAGSTYAIFTSNTQVDMTIQSATVSVVSEIVDNSLKLYSRNILQTNPADKFANLGEAELNSNELLLTNITPGDKATFQIKVTNESNVNIKYRVTWTVENTALTQGSYPLTAAASENGTAVATGTSGWTEWLITDSAEKTIDVVIELPIEAGNEYQNKSTSVLFFVEAVQGNAEDLYVAP